MLQRLRNLIELFAKYSFDLVGYEKSRNYGLSLGPAEF